MPDSSPFVCDAEALRRLAPESVLRDAHQDHAVHRVLEAGDHGGDLHATVEDPSGDVLLLRVQLDEDGLFVGSCACGTSGHTFCRHALAALIAHAHAEHAAAAPDAATAAEEAVAARVQRARTQVAVKHLGGDTFFGTFEAWSVGSERRWRVQIRSLTERVNHCSCPDFAVNHLGICKHTEAVLMHLQRRAPRRFETLAARGPSHAMLVLAWDAPESPAVRLVLPREPDEVLLALARRWCTADGLCDRGRLFDLLRDVQGRADVQVGDEVGAFARRLAEEAVQSERAAALSARIRAGGGRLPGVHARLYPYQVDGVAFLASAGRAVLADDMGLGKTLQAIAAAHWMMEDKHIRRVVVVCPASLKHQWAREIERFTGRDAVVVQGNPKDRLALYRRRAHFTVLNYELVRADLGWLQSELGADLLVLDEAQRIKNWRTKTAAAVKQLDTRYVFVLSGTPLENRLEDLYSVLQVVDPRVLGPLWRFQIDFHLTDPQGRVLGYRNLGELRRRLAPVLLRRERTLVRDQLPDRITTRLDLPLDPLQRALHDQAVESARVIAQTAINQRRPLTPAEENRLMAALQTARMACDAAGLLDGETPSSPKLEELGRLLEEACVDGGRKVVVFSQWRRMTALAEKVALGLGLGVVNLHGGVPSSARGELVRRFFEDPGAQVFVSTDAGATGLNLQCATMLVHLDGPGTPRCSTSARPGSTGSARRSPCTSCTWCRPTATRPGWQPWCTASGSCSTTWCARAATRTRWASRGARSTSR